MIVLVVFNFGFHWHIFDFDPPPFSSSIAVPCTVQDAVVDKLHCATQKNSKTKQFDFGKFEGAEHEYEIYFFLTCQVFSAFYILIWKHWPEFSLLD